VASTAAAVTVFGWHYRRALPLCAAFAIVMCLSRVHNGMHYPSDVLSGSILGVGYGLLAVRLVERFAKRRAAAVAPAESMVRSNR
jgi:membrane-associated phospholipid phosphatase